MSESALVRAIRIDQGAQPDIRVFREQVGSFYPLSSIGKDGRLKPNAYPIDIGVKGKPDLLLIIGPRYLWLETKFATNPTPEQLDFAAMVHALGGAHAFVRTVDEARAAVAAVRALNAGTLSQTDVSAGRTDNQEPHHGGHLTARATTGHRMDTGAHP